MKKEMEMQGLDELPEDLEDVVFTRDGNGNLVEMVVIDDVADD